MRVKIVASLPTATQDQMDITPLIGNIYEVIDTGEDLDDYEVQVKLEDDTIIILNEHEYEVIR